MKRAEKGEGFPGQRIVVLPRPVMAAVAKHALIGDLMPTDAGYFPHARGHRRERSGGVDQAIFIYCLKGAGWCEMEGRRHAVHAGDLLVIPPDVPHAYGAESARPWSIYWLHGKGAKLGVFLEELGAATATPVLRFGENLQLVSLFEEIVEMVEHGYAQHQLLCASQAFRHLLAVMIRSRRENQAELPDTRFKVTQTIPYMKQHLDEPLKLDALAALAGLSRSQYAALFKEQTGYAPMDYFTRLRIHRACQWLDTSDLSIKAVAAKVGYEDPLYFSRVFRTVNAVSPLQYRRLRKG
jgi:AraC-like DNA-binding protein